jgi:hypothetical protein
MPRPLNNALYKNEVKPSTKNGETNLPSDNKNLRAFKRTWAQKPLKNPTYPNQKWQTGFKNLKKRGGGRVNRKVFEQNTKRGSQMLHGYPLTSRVHQHDEHLHSKPLIKNMRKRNQNQMGWAHDLNVVDRAIKTSQNPRGKPKGAQVEHLEG